MDNPSVEALIHQVLHIYLQMALPCEIYKQSNSQAIDFTYLTNQ